jgi:hypothetical protein
MVDRDTLNQINDLFTSFMADPKLTAADTQAKFVDIIKNAAK